MRHQVLLLAIVVLPGFIACANEGGEETGSGSSSGGSRVCAPGDQKACACPNGAQGVQTCREDGSGWQICLSCGAASSSSSGLPGPTLDQGTTAMANGFCQKFQACSPAYLQYVFGDVAQCQARMKTVYGVIGSASGTGASAQLMVDCGSAMGATSCDAFFNNEFPPSCMTVETGPGLLPNGNPCGLDAQCQSQYCRTTVGGCGVCSQRTGLGGTCAASSECAAGVCVNGSCAEPGDVGAACSQSRPCKRALPCANGYCRQPKHNAGDTCDPNVYIDCDYFRLLYCTTAGVCTQWQQSAAGANCDNKTSVCGGSGFCRMSGATGNCVAPAADGMPCNATSGPQCLYPAQCVNGSCRLPTAACQ